MNSEMADQPHLPCLVSCEEGSVRLAKVNGATPQLLRWKSPACAGCVELPVYVDEWHGSSTNGTIEQVVVRIHGRERDADVAWADIAAARSRLAVEEQRRTLLVVPQFLNGLDKAKFQSSKQSDSGRILVWKANGWGEGSPSVRPKPSRSDIAAGVSSFEALDAIVGHFADQQRYRSITRIVFSGHSMGGQLVHRYSILGSPVLPLEGRRSLRIEYVVMNPASYLYFNARREGPSSQVQLRDANVYKYGFDELATHIPSYPPIQDHHDPQWYRDRMLERHIHFVHGASDRGTGDDRPEAMAQGANRYVRATNYHGHLEQMERGTGRTKERLWTVDWVQGVGHDGRAITTSDAAIARIFTRTTACSSFITFD